MGMRKQSGWSEGLSKGVKERQRHEGRLLPGLTGKGLSTLQGKSPSRSLHWLLTT